MEILRYLAYPLVFAGRLILFPIWLLSGFVPRRSELWVFGSWGGTRFADNGAAFFTYCHANIDPGIELVWISQDRTIVRDLRRQGYVAHLRWSLGGMAACLRAGFHFFDCFAKDTNYWLSRGAVKINLWSGVPLKVFEREIDNPQNRYYRLFHGRLPERWLLTLMMPWHVERPDLLIATSEETAQITCRGFGVSRDRVVVTGFPRNDMLLAPTLQPNATGLPPPFAAAAAAGETIFLYLPTYRDDASAYPAGIDWKRLDELMIRRNARLFCKFHPMAESGLDTGLRRIVELPRHLDVYPLLPHTRALISDYSSVIFDYMLLSRPIVYFTPDLQEFISGSRRLNFQPADVAVGPLCADFEQLLQALDRIAQGEDPAGPKRREEVLARLHVYVDAEAGRRVLALVQERHLRQRVKPAIVALR